MSSNPNPTPAQNAFDWVAQELEFPSESARTALRQAFLSVANGGHANATKALERAWEEGARWPSGETYLRAQGWRPEGEVDSDGDDEYDGPDLLELLCDRLMHASFRMARNAQVRSVLDPASAQHNPAYTHALLNKNGDFLGDPCNVGIDKIISVQEALQMMEQPAHAHPECRCSIDPFPVTSWDRDRLKTERQGVSNPVLAPQNRGQMILTLNGVEYDYTHHPLFQEIHPMIAMGRWDEGRRYLQKIAYGIKAATEQEQMEFKHIAMVFAAVDPLSVQCLRGIQPILDEHPEGIRQTALYPHMAAAPDAETARYVLYYAAEMGAIRREKKGNSYLVFPVQKGPNVDFTTLK